MKTWFITILATKANLSSANLFHFIASTYTSANLLRPSVSGNFHDETKSYTVLQSKPTLRTDSCIIDDVTHTPNTASLCQMRPQAIDPLALSGNVENVLSFPPSALSSSFSCSFFGAAPGLYEIGSFLKVSNAPWKLSALATPETHEWITTTRA